MHIAERLESYRKMSDAHRAGVGLCGVPGGRT